mgnify:CR=1 FL=1
MGHKVYVSQHPNLRITLLYAQMYGPKGKSAQFINGIYATSDEGEQEEIEKSPSFLRGRVVVASETKDETDEIVAPAPTPVAPQPEPQPRVGGKFVSKAGGAKK